MVKETYAQVGVTFFFCVDDNDVINIIIYMVMIMHAVVAYIKM